jgi:hypothetical protein
LRLALHSARLVRSKAWRTGYPPHAHPAIETYLVVAGNTAWQLGADALRRQPPGAVIFHPSGIAHTMETFAQPLLAILFLARRRGFALGPSGRLIRDVKARRRPSPGHGR